MNKLILIPVSFLVLGVQAQEIRKKVDEQLVNKEIAADTSKKSKIKLGGIVGVSLNQQNSSYWVGANEKFALNVGLSADLYANAALKKGNWNNTLKMNYAWVNNQSQGLRKTSDFIDLFSKYGRRLHKDGKLSLSAIGNLRTQFSNGYDYELTPRRRTSGFFAPATILFTPGLEWKPTGKFSLFMSPLAARWVIVSNDPYSYSFPNGIKPDGTREKPIAELYGVDPEKKSEGQFGAFISANLKTELVKNVSYSSRLDLYSNYLSNPQNIDLFWTNSLVLKVNKWLGVSYQFNLAYDDDFRPEGESGPRMQFLGILAIGVTSNF